MDFEAQIEEIRIQDHSGYTLLITTHYEQHKSLLWLTLRNVGELCKEMFSPLILGRIKNCFHCRKNDSEEVSKVQATTRVAYQKKDRLFTAQNKRNDTIFERI